MPDEPEEQAVKKFQLQLETFGQQARPKFSIIGDLSLCMRTCSTPEVKLTLSEATRRAMAELEKQRMTLEAKIKKDLEMAAKAAEKAKKSAKGKPGASSKPPNIKEKQKKTKLKLKLMVDKFNKKYLPSDHSIWLELSTKPKNEPPFVDYKKTQLMLNYGIKF
ncbi:MAG: hypothetical protein AB3N11_02940 [Arenibacterium sp.]